MHLKNVSIDQARFPTREHYPFSLDVLQQTKRLDFTTPVTFFVGENGTGKSTLLQAISRKCDIHMWEGMHRTRCEFNPHEDKLYLTLDAKWADGHVPGSFFSSQIFRNFAQLVDDWATSDPAVLKHYGGHSLITLSHGESFMSYFRARYKIKGLYLMDEPETALSPRSQLALLRLLHDMGQAGHAQFIIATHSPILLACPDATIYTFDTVPVQEVPYEETEHYGVYRDFMADPHAFLDERADA